MTGIFLLVPRYNWRAPLSHSSSCMLVNNGPSLQSSKEEHQPWKWGATTRYHASHTKTMLPTKESMLIFSRQSDHTKTSWRSWRNANSISRSSGLAINYLARHSERGKKTRQTEEEVGRQQGMDRPGVRQVQDGSGEYGKMEETGCEMICGASTTFVVKG